MKKRIVALVLVAVMTILSLASCSAAFDFAKEDLTSYATFDYAQFKEALQKLVIENDETTEYTTDEKINETREKEALYGDIAEAIIAAATDSDKKTEGKLGESDVLNFVYYAEADGKVYFSSNMNVSAISSAASSHVLKLGEIDVDDSADDEFLKLVKANLADVDVKDYIYSMVTSAEEAVKAGDTVYVSYKRSYQNTDENGTKLDVSETANYQKVTIADDGSAFSKLIGTKVGATYTITNDDKTTTKTFEMVEDGVTVTYSDLKVLWLVEKEGEAIATFKYTPYTSAKSVTPDNLYSGSGVDLKDVELTYYVFPVNYIHIPSADEIDATDILKNVYGKNLSSDAFEVFGEEYVYTEGDKSEKIADLVAEVAKIFDTTAKDKAYYADDSELAKLLKEYEDAKKAAEATDADDAAKAAKTEKEEALTAAQNAELDKVIAKIVAAKKGDALANDAIVAEYKKNIKHNLKDEYNAAVTEKVQAAIWKLIEDSVTVKGYPISLVEDYADHLYESYEYKFHKGDHDDPDHEHTADEKLPYESFDTVEAYIRSELKLGATDDVKVALETEAKKYIDPIIKLYVVSKACESDAIKAMTGENGYVRLDVKSGVYTIDEEIYKETYGDRADEKIADAKENMEKTIAFNEANADKFIIDDEFMKAYRDLNGKAYYDQMINNYGDINVRAALQFERLFYYLASQNVSAAEENAHGHTTEVNYVDAYGDGVMYLDFRTVKYTFASDEVAE